MGNKSEILNELRETASQLASLNKADVYSVPENYFNKLSDIILSKIKSSEDELGEIAPTLSGISKQNVYTVPSNYFETLQVNISSRKQLAKIIPVRRQINVFMKYAVAAVAAGIIFTGSYLFNHYSSNSNTSTLNVTSEMKSVTDDELNKYADEHAIQFTDDNFKENNDELNIAAELKTVSNDELQQYYNNDYIASRAK